MLQFDRMTLRNFLSYGNYDTEVQLGDAQQCFIYGKVLDSTDQTGERFPSNGAGKSSLMQALIWCLFGRTMHNRQPGKSILNKFTDSDAIVRVTLKNGDIVERIMTVGGETQLTLYKDGKEVINSTLSTMPHQQKVLQNELNLDFDIFCGSVFVSQFRKGWLEMQPSARQKALERLFGVEKLNTYAEVAKRKRDETKSVQDISREKLNGFQSRREDLLKHKELAQTNFEEFETTRKNKYNNKLAESRELLEQSRQVKHINLDDLKTKWQTVHKIRNILDGINKKIDGLEEKVTELESQKEPIIKQRDKSLARVNADLDKQLNSIRKSHDGSLKKLANTISDIVLLVGSIKSTNANTLAALAGERKQRQSLIDSWMECSGQLCVECEQPITAEYVDDKIKPICDQLASLDDEFLAMSYFDRILDDLVLTRVCSILAVEAVISESHDAKSAELNGAADEQRARIADNFDQELAKVDSNIVNAKNKRQELRATFNDTNNKLIALTPSVTLEAAEKSNSQSKALREAALSAANSAKSILEDPNPYKSIINNLLRDLDKLDGSVKAEEVAIERQNYVWEHYQYINKAYADRRKIKSFAIGKRIPYFNSRLDYYLETLNLDARIYLTDSLSLDSSHWSYDYLSSGERTKADLAYTFSVFDLHESVYGPQSNIMVLDEPEKGLDDVGRDKLLYIIQTDLAPRFESLFIISHYAPFRNVFPKHIVVERSGRLSTIADSR